jgi:hypothetical protein
VSRVLSVKKWESEAVRSPKMVGGVVALDSLYCGSLDDNGIGKNSSSADCLYLFLRK